MFYIFFHFLIARKLRNINSKNNRFSIDSNCDKLRNIEINGEDKFWRLKHGQKDKK